MKYKFQCKWCGIEVLDWPCRRKLTCSRSCQVKLANTGKKRSSLWDKLPYFLELYDSGLTFAEIAKENNIGWWSLQRLFKKACIKTRRTGIRNGRTPWNKGKKNPSMMGKNNPNWNGGITPLGAYIRTSLEYKHWRTKVFIRDNRQCVLCGSGLEIEADHYPKLFSQILRQDKIDSFEKAAACLLLWDVNNGRTLCRNCHIKITSEQRRNSFK